MNLRYALGEVREHGTDREWWRKRFLTHVVGRYFGLDMDGSALYLAAWSDDDAERLLERCERIQETSTTVIDRIAAQPDPIDHE